MGRYLVVANQTLGSEPLLEELRARAEDEEDCSFHVVVPATPPSEFHFHSEGEAVAVARERLEGALARLKEAGLSVSGVVGDPHPEDAVRDALRAAECEGVIVCTLPVGISRWLRLDLPHRISRIVDVPVVHVTAEPEEVEAGGGGA